MGNIVLIGFMGTGKSTVSEKLGFVSGMDVVDMDNMISAREELSISEIFSRYGEEYFRVLETKLLIELQNRQNIIISCGGGTAMRDGNVVEMKKNGKVVLLAATAETILERLEGDEKRPLLKNRKSIEDISELMEMRRPKYESAADVIIETDGKTVEEICKEIMNKI